MEFGSDADEIVFPGAVRLMPVVSADPHLNELLIKYSEEALAHRPANRAPLRSSVENAIAPLLPHGKAGAGEVARRLGMSNRTLARRRLTGPWLALRPCGAKFNVRFVWS